MSDSESSDDSYSAPSFDSWEEVILHYKEFILGDVNGCPTHPAPLCEESHLIKKELLIMNEYGIVTITSQPGLSKKCDDSTKTMWQREFVDGYMKTELYDKLFEKLHNSDFIMLDCSVDPYGSYDGHTRILVTKFVSELGNGKEHVHKCSHASTDGASCELDQIFENSDQDVMFEIAPDLVYFAIIDPVWARQNVLCSAICDAIKNS